MYNDLFYSYCFRDLAKSQCYFSCYEHLVPAYQHPYRLCPDEKAETNGVCWPNTLFFIGRYFIQYRGWNLRNLEKLILRINPRLKIWKGCNFVCWKSVSTIQLYVFNVFLSNLLTAKLTKLTMIDTPNIYIYIYIYIYIFQKGNVTSYNSRIIQAYFQPKMGRKKTRIFSL